MPRAFDITAATLIMVALLGMATLVLVTMAQSHNSWTEQPTLVIRVMNDIGLHRIPGWTLIAAASPGALLCALTSVASIIDSIRRQQTSRIVPECLLPWAVTWFTITTALGHYPATQTAGMIMVATTAIAFLAAFPVYYAVKRYSRRRLRT